jgi:NitT/TauT family transport system permease protein
MNMTVTKGKKFNLRHAIKRIIYNMRQSLPSVFSVIAVIVIWQLSVMIFSIPNYILPSPIASIEALIKYWPQIQKNLFTTMYEIMIGYSATVVISIPIATLISYSRTFEKTIYPFMVLIQLIPKVAIAPLFVIWFGFGVMPKILMVFLLSFFPLLIDATVGLKSLNGRLIYLSKTMSDSEWKFFWKIKLPNALPHIFAGLKVSIAFATVGAIVAEFLGSDSGLGNLLLRANGDYNTRLLFALLIVLSAMGIFFYKIIEIIEKRVIPWHISQRADSMDSKFDATTM